MPVHAAAVAATILAAFCVAGVAMAEPSFDGRWVAENQSLTLDLSRCGEGWCGVEVKAGACGRTVLRVAADSPDEGRHPIGRLELAPEARPMPIKIHLFKRATGAFDSLMILGDSGGRFDLMRRTYPYMVAFSRSGDAACRHDPKVS